MLWLWPPWDPEIHATRVRLRGKVMILIDETTVPESERPDLAKVNAELESIAAGRLRQIDPCEEPYSSSKIA